MCMRFHNLFSTHKMEYIKSCSGFAGCILCKILKNESDNKDTTRLLVVEGHYSAVCVNKFPYNSGHLLIFPRRHITDYREYTPPEEEEISMWIKESLNILDRLYKPTGYNIGYNMGQFAGASIAHLHIHLIPRFKNELGFIDIIGGAKIIVENPVKTMERLKKEYAKLNL